MTRTPKKLRVARLNRIIAERTSDGFKQHIAGKTSPADVADAFDYDMKNFEDCRDLMQAEYDQIEYPTDEDQADIARRYAYILGISIILFGLAFRDDEGNVFVVDTDGRLQKVDEGENKKPETLFKNED